MQPVICPHCRAAIANEPQFAGTVCRCYQCGGQFQMPAIEPDFQFSQHAPPPVYRNRPVLTEQTAKQFKIIQACGLLMMVVSLPMVGLAFVRPQLWSLAVAFCVVSLLVFMTGRIAAWWHHG